jgi:osmotically-inducible protein OsmY
MVCSFFRGKQAVNSDTRILREVIGALTAIPTLYHSRLCVAVRDGIVTVLGQVSAPAERQVIEQAVKRVAGIRTLVLEIGTIMTPDIVTGT